MNFADRTTKYNLKYRGRVVLFDCLCHEAGNYVHEHTPYYFSQALEHGYSLHPCK